MKYWLYQFEKRQGSSTVLKSETFPGNRPKAQGEA